MLFLGLKFQTLDIKEMETLQNFLSNISDEKNPEGSSIPEQVLYYFTFIQENPSIKTIVEIGFNLGISAAAFLAGRPDTRVVSIDIGDHTYVLEGKRNIDKHFPGRHSLVIGNSADALPFLHNFFGTKTVDLFLVDGCHIAPMPQIDIENALRWMSNDSFLLVDDVCEAWGNEGVNEAVAYFEKEGKIKIFDVCKIYDRGWILAKKSSLSKTAN